MSSLRRVRTSRLALAALVVVGLTPPRAAVAHIEHLEIEVGDFRFDALAAGPTDGPLIFLLHGFPQS